MVHSSANYTCSSELNAPVNLIVFNIWALSLAMVGIVFLRLYDTFPAAASSSASHWVLFLPGSAYLHCISIPVKITYRILSNNFSYVTFCMSDVVEAV